MMSERFSGLLTTNPTILVYGWYHQGNLGDDLFAEAFKHLFPLFNFIFTDHIDPCHLEGIDAVFFGGGSFLGEPIKIFDDATFETLKQKKIFYIGVGSETEINSRHQQLLMLAELIALRSNINFDNIKKINQNTIVIADLVYSLPANSFSVKIPKSILFIPNISVVPKWDGPHWKHAAWDYFKIEVAQLLEQLSKDKYTINFLPFCINKELNDCYAAGEIINRINDNSEIILLNKPIDIQSSIELISKYQLVITQRYHGTILAEMAGTSCLTIHHHDKLKNSTGARVSYYGINKNSLIEEVNNLLMGRVSKILPIDRNIYTDLKQKVEHAICRS